MAIGARKAFQELPSEIERDRWLGLPFLGCDGLPNTGQSWVRSGLLTATIFIPPNTGQAMEMLVDALQNGKAQPERALTNAVSVPRAGSVASTQVISRISFPRPAAGRIIFVV